MEGDRRGKRQRPEDAAVLGIPCEKDAEEEQVEEFFALLKSIREMRSELRRRVGAGVSRKRTKAKGSAWTPTFHWEDFAEAGGDGPPAGVPSMAAAEKGIRVKETEEESTGLDLKLSL
ncbi:hypothetical protein Taro_027379 [Colocasia esculenta]|uniref:Uncharacterized protein n=1 Tax=Colocasia esculenta TaxID=4460 RepID=A0A843VRE7_COLES|nr:hypothetical protein [Colocasia esculenta]